MLHWKRMLDAKPAEHEPQPHRIMTTVWGDDLRGFEDVLQREGDLPEGRYIVTYWWYDGQDLVQLADVGITKQDIIENVRDQKYKEGADYFLMMG